MQFSLASLFHDSYIQGLKEYVSCFSKKKSISFFFHAHFLEYDLVLKLSRLSDGEKLK